MIILSAEDVRKALPMPQAIKAVKGAFAALSAGQVEVPIRTQLPVPPHNAISLFMPAFVEDEGGQALTVKVVSVFPHNPERGLPLIYAAVLVLEPDSGRPLALLEGGALTAIRTGAASGAASDILAREDSQVLAIFGAGTQGATQIEAVCAVRPIQTVWVFDPDTQKALSLIGRAANQLAASINIHQAQSPAQAVKDADIICTATTSTTAVFDDADLKPGAHINGVGSYTEEMQEIPVETVKRALLVVDERAAALAEAGDIIQPLEQGEIDPNHIHAELGEIILDRKSGRTDAGRITFFKSVGNAVQDAASARLALKNAKVMGLGQNISW
ncbi:ornithine cyclodeaminase family protein [Chloroflexota bacterium]